MTATIYKCWKAGETRVPRGVYGNCYNVECAGRPEREHRVKATITSVTQAIQVRKHEGGQH